MILDRRRLRVPLWLIWSTTVGLSTIAFTIWYWLIDPTYVKLLGFVGGVAAGLFVYFLTYVTVLPSVIQLDRFRSMGVKALLANRHDQKYYRKLLEGSQARIDVMGASCSRFVRDFLDINSDDKILIDALSRHQRLKIRMLVPNQDHMDQEAQGRIAATIRQIELVQERFPRRVELRRFNEEARHSFVITDKDLVAGPIFDDQQSRHAPAVHVASDTIFGQKYSAYFDAEWNRADGE